MPTFNRYLNGIIKSEHIVAGGVATADIADAAITEPKLGTYQVRVMKFFYDGTSLTTGAKTLTAADGSTQQLPAGAIVLSTFVNALPPLASGGSATVAIGYTGVAAAFHGATAFNGANLVQATAKWTVAASAPYVGAAPVSVIWTIATADLTGGLAEVYVQYITTL
jgi:uncharacterized Zn-binding protein involved in type VI secretion